MTEATISYAARYQFVDYHKRTQRWACIVAHRRCGKTVATVADLVDAAVFNTKPNPRYAYVAPFFRQAKDVAFQILKDLCADLLAKGAAVVNESELRVDFPHNGARVRLYGADNYDAMRGQFHWLDALDVDLLKDGKPIDRSFLE